MGNNCSKCNISKDSLDEKLIQCSGCVDVFLCPKCINFIDGYCSDCILQHTKRHQNKIIFKHLCKKVELEFDDDIIDNIINEMLKHLSLTRTAVEREILQNKTKYIKGINNLRR